MKLNPKNYASSLYNLLDGKKADEVGSILKNFVEVLAENNQLSKAERIIAEFSKVWNRENGIVEAEIISANELDEGITEKIKKYIAGVSGRKKVEIKNRIDRKILGGVIIKYDDQILDASLKTKLTSLKERMIK